MAMAQMREKRFIQIILWTVIVAFIGTIFIAWGMQNYGGKFTRDPNLVAQVGKQEVTHVELSKAMEPITRQIYGEGLEIDPAEEDQLRRRVLDQLIDEAALREAGRRMNLSVSDEEVAAALQREQAFQDENRRFNKERYQQLLEANGMTPSGFEQGLRQDILSQKIRTLLDDSILYTPAELDRFAGLLNRELKADYVAIDQKKLGAGFRPAAEDLQDYFDANRSRWDKPERAKVRHILLQLGDKATPQEEEIAKKAIEDYRKQILEKKSTFVEIAKKYSQDTGTKNKGGELGWVVRGTMRIPAFEDVAFKLAKGELSKPVRTQFGYHLIQLEDYEKEKLAVFAAIRAEVDKAYRTTEASKVARRQLRQVSDRLLAGESLSTTAKALKLQTKSTEWFTAEKGIPGWKDSKKAAESLAAKHLGEWGGPFYLGDLQVIVQITSEKQRPVSKTEVEKRRTDLQMMLLDYKRDLWVKSFLAAERKALKVRIYLPDAT